MKQYFITWRGKAGIRFMTVSADSKELAVEVITAAFPGAGIQTIRENTLPWTMVAEQK
jgi:hypothetical protein